MAISLRNQPPIFPTPTITPTPTLTPISSIEFENNLLYPGFKFLYSPDFRVKYQEHDEITKQYTYVDSCDLQCTGLRVESQQTTLDFGNITGGSDNQGLDCTNILSYTKISDEWSRFLSDLKGEVVYVTNNVIRENQTITHNERIFSHGIETDDWSVIEGKKYDYCYYGKGAL